jgi:hypothetical protein
VVNKAPVRRAAGKNRLIDQVLGFAVKRTLLSYNYILCRERNFYRRFRATLRRKIDRIGKKKPLCFGQEGFQGLKP